MTTIPVNADERAMLLAAFKKHGEPERADVRWGCREGHLHHTKSAAEAHGRARLEEASEWLIDHHARPALEPARFRVVAGPPGTAPSVTTLEDVEDLKRRGMMKP